MSRNVGKCIFRKYLLKGVWICEEKNEAWIIPLSLSLFVLGNTEHGVSNEPAPAGAWNQKLSMCRGRGKIERRKKTIIMAAYQIPLSWADGHREGCVLQLDIP